MIEVKDISKVFKLYRDPKDRLKEILFRKQYYKEFTALKSVSFTVADGETMGIIGENGAGKSTLLKLLTGVLLPTSGEIHVRGLVTGLLELGTGFNPELTGFNNIYMNGLLIGMSREEINEKVDKIIEFAELGEFIEEPLKMYSSGMMMRLAFSIATHAEPDTFVVDEALSVGDAYFQQKCMSRIRDLKKRGASIVFVSHELNAVKVLCDKAMLLNHGEVVEEGAPDNIINTYNFMLAKKSKGQEVRMERLNDGTSYGNFKAKIKAIELLNQSFIDARTFVSGEEITIALTIGATEYLDSVVVGILIRDRFGQDMFGTNTHHLQRVVSMNRGETFAYEYRFKLNIGPGKYTLTVAVHGDETHIERSYIWCDNIINFEVIGDKDYKFSGLARLDVNLELKEAGQS